MAGDTRVEFFLCHANFLVKVLLDHVVQRFVLNHGALKRKELAAWQIRALNHQRYTIGNTQALDLVQTLAQACVHLCRNILISLDLGKLKNRRLGHTADRPHLLGKAIGLREVCRLQRAVAHHGSTAALTNHQAQALKLLQGKANRCTREPIAFRQVTLRRQIVAGSKLVIDFIGQQIDELIVQRLFARSHCHNDTCRINDSKLVVTRHHVL